MQETSRSNALLLSVVVLLLGGVGAGWYTSTLESPRPDAPAVTRSTEHPVGAFRARLWEDPFVAVSRFEQRYPSDPGSDDARSDGCRHDIDSFLEDVARAADQSPDGVHVMMVMVPYDPSVESHEFRLRSRRALSSGLKASGYIPTHPDRLNYVQIQWKRDPEGELSKKNLVQWEAPYEWFHADEFLAHSGSEPSGPESNASDNGTGDSQTGTAWQSPQRVLVLWLDDVRFRQRPLVRLAQMANLFRPERRSDGHGLKEFPTIHVFGPDNSDTLVAMVTDARQLMEAKPGYWSNGWPSLDSLVLLARRGAPFATTNDRRAFVAFARSIGEAVPGVVEAGKALWRAIEIDVKGTASEANSWLRLGQRCGCGNHLNEVDIVNLLRKITIYSHRSTAAPHLVWQEARAGQRHASEKSRGNPAQPESKTAGHVIRKLTRGFVRTVGDDRALAEVLLQELHRRGVQLFSEDGEAGEDLQPIVLISEWDTAYGRTFSLTFQSALERLRDASTNGEAALGTYSAARDLIRKRNDRYRSVFSRLFGNQQDIDLDSVIPVRHYTYFRGIDGKSAFASAAGGDQQSERRGDSYPDDEFASIWIQQPERPVGEAQSDYARRIAEKLGADYPPAAIGIVGTDVYDKILLLKALRDEFHNDVIFFTTDLDARLFYHKYLDATRNLIVASHFGLSLRGNFRRDLQSPQSFRRTEKFRDTYQTALFFATRLSLGLPVDADDLGAGFVKEKEVPQYLDEPRLYEIGHEEAVDISPELRSSSGSSLKLSNLQNAAETELHLSSGNGRELTAASPLPEDGHLNVDAEFDVCVDGGPPHRVRIDREDTGNNESREELLADIRYAVEAAFKSPLGSRSIEVPVEVDMADAHLVLRPDRYVHNEVREGLDALVPEPRRWSVRDWFAGDEQEENSIVGLPLWMPQQEPNWLIWVGVAVLVGVTGMAWRIYEKFFSTTYPKLSTPERACYWGLAGVAVIIAFALLVYFQSFYAAWSGEEVFSLTSGVSAWPAILLRGLALFLSVWFMVRVAHKVRVSDSDLNSDIPVRRRVRSSAFRRRSCRLAFDKAHKQAPDPEPYQQPTEDSFARVSARLAWLGKKSTRWLQRLWIAAREHRESIRIHQITNARKRDIDRLWADYEVLGRFRHALLRTIIPGVVIYLLIATLTCAVLGWPNSPVRGEFSRTLTKVVTWGSVVAMVALVFYILDVTLLCGEFIRGVRSHLEARSTQAGQVQQGDLSGKDPYDLLRLMAERTQVVGALIFYPAIVLLIMILARSNWFDAWNFPLSLIFLFVLLGTVVVGLAWLLRHDAKKARSETLEILDRSRIQVLKAEQGARDAARITRLMARIRSLRTGAFSPIGGNPVLYSLLIPSGGYGLFWSALQLWTTG